MRIESLPASTVGNPARRVQQPDENFGQMLMDVMKEVSSAEQQSTSMQNAFMTGQPVEFHDLMVAMEKASVSMQLTLQVRNKLLEAYQEISRMQV